MPHYHPYSRFYVVEALEFGNKMVGCIPESLICDIYLWATKIVYYISFTQYFSLSKKYCLCYKHCFLYCSFPNKMVLGRTHIKDVAAKRKVELNSYIQSLMNASTDVSEVIMKSILMT